MAEYRRFIDSRTKAKANPKPGVFLSGWRDDYSVQSGRLSLDPAKLGAALRAADTGNTTAMFEIFDAVEQDPHVHAVLSKRKRRVLSRTMAIKPAVEDDANAQKAADLCRELVLGEGAAEGIANWRAALLDLSDAIGRGFALMQIVWVNEGSTWRPAKLNRWPQRDTVLGQPWGGGQDHDDDEVRVITAGQPVYGEPLEPNQWMLYVNKARSDTLARAALLRSCVWYWLFKHFSMRDWTIFADRYGMPVRVGKYNKSANDEERNALLDAVVTLGKDGGAIMPEGTTLELVESAHTGEHPFRSLVEMCDFQISKAILGGTLTTDAGEKGARSLGEVHERTETDIADEDAKALEAAIKRDLLRPIVLFNLGERYPVPDVEFQAAENEDLKARAERDKILFKDIGLPVAKSYLYDAYEIPEPEAGQELLTVPKPPPPAFGGAPGEPDDEDADVEPPPGDDDEVEVEQLANRLGLNLRDVRALVQKKKSQSWAQ